MAPAGSRTAELRAAIGHQPPPPLVPVGVRATVHAVANQLPRVALGWHTRAAGGEPARGGGAEVVVHEVVQLSAAVSAYHCTFTYLWVGLQAAIVFEMAGLEGDWDPASVSLNEVSPPRRQLSELFVHVNAPDDNIWCPFVLAKDGVKDGVSDIWRNISPGEPKAAYAQLEAWKALLSHSVRSPPTRRRCVTGCARWSGEEPLHAASASAVSCAKRSWQPLASRPPSPRSVEGRREEAAALDAALGPGAVVDAAAVAAFFHLMTRGVDTVWHAAAATKVFQMMGIIMRLKNIALDWAGWLLSPALSWR
eukprot:jgi/Tetstr1/457606/TSEL_044173.t1